MTATSEDGQVPGSVGLPGSLSQWWSALFRPARPLTGEQQRDLDEQREGGWQQRARCAEADPEAWFPDRGSVAPAQAFAICASCPVRRSCLATALLGHEYGVWAGTTALQREELYRLLRADVSVAALLELALNTPVGREVHDAKADAA